MQLSFGNKVFHFYRNLAPPARLPKGVSAMNPYRKQTARGYIKEFLEKFFPDAEKRIFVFGINPGRFGAGVTGIAFTDPVALANVCGVSNDLAKRREVSSEFVYSFIEKWGGAGKFYRDFFLTAICPLGFVKNGINCNFYDDKKLLAAVRPFIAETIKAQIMCGARAGAAIVFGAGKNKKVFDELNAEHNFFKKVYALEHPRFIMQYRRRKLRAYLKKYHDVFSLALLSG